MRPDGTPHQSQGVGGMWTRFRLGASAFAVGLIGWTMIFGAPPAAAAICLAPTGGNYYAATAQCSGSTNWGGGSARWDTQNYYATDWSSGGFASEVLWVFTRSASTCWVETGYTHGWQGQNLRTLYWVDGCPYSEHRITAYSAGSVGSLHVYTIQEINSSTYTVYFDYNTVSNTSEPNWTRYVATGLETTDYYATFPTTHEDAIQYRDSACCTGHWHYTTQNSYYEDRPPFDWTWTINYHAGNNGRCGC